MSFLFNNGTYAIVPIADIRPQWETRKRQKYVDIDILARSIAQAGLMNPLTVYSINCEPPYELVAGGRRLKALMMLQHHEVAVHIYDRVLSTKELRALELYENLHRDRLTFEEEAIFVKEMYEMLRDIYGDSVPGMKNPQGSSLANTAKMLSMNVSTASNALNLARAMEEFPELQLEKSKNKSAAIKRVQRYKNIVTAQVTAANSKLDSQNTGYFVGDFFDNKLEAESFQFLEVDPPYSIDIVNLQWYSDKQLAEDNYVEIAPENYPEFLSRLCRETYRLAAPGAWMIFWYGIQWHQCVLSALRAEGWQTGHLPAIWVKTNVTGQTHAARLYLGTTYEMFFYARKGDATIRKQGRSNTFLFQPLSAQAKALMHPTAKPIDLLKEIIETFCWPGSNILVPFAGSGNTLEAADILGFKACGFDLSEEFYSNFILRRSQRLAALSAAKR